MKKIYLLLIMAFTTASLFAQAPQAFKYQAIARDEAGNILTNSPVSIRVSMVKGGMDGTLSYVETQQVKSNSFGMINLVIGKGDVVTGDFSEVNWGNDSYYIMVEMDMTGGTNYKDMGTSQLYAVPYALYAEKAGSLLGNNSDLSTLKSTPNGYKRTGGIRNGTPNSKFPATGNSFMNVNTGNFGIGTTNPLTKLAVVGDVGITNGLTVTAGDIMLKPAGSGGTPGQFLQTDGTGAATWATVSGGSAGDHIAEGDSKVEVVDTSPGYVTFEIDAVEKLRLTGNALEFRNNDSSVYIGYQAGNSISGDERGHNVFAGYQSGFNSSATGFDASYNIFIGQWAGYSNTIGSYNVYIGDESGTSNSEGNENVIIGDNAGYLNEGDYNVFIGSEAGSSNTGASDNVFVGAYAGYYNTGSHNVFVGSEAGYYNEGGGDNVFVGWEAGEDNEDGSDNVFVGSHAGQDNISGDYNVFVGYDAGYSNDYGNYNVFVGYDAGYSNEGGGDNVFVGYYAGESNVGGEYNVFIGYNAGYDNDDGSNNVIIGDESGGNNEGGDDNVFVGQDAGYSNVDGDNNVYIGSEAGNDNTAGSANVFVGYNAGYFETGSDKLYIANSDTTKPLIYGNFATDKVTINNVIRLTPQATAPTSPVEGELYVNFTDHHIYCFLNNAWVQLD